MSEDTQDQAPTMEQVEALEDRLAQLRDDLEQEQKAAAAAAVKTREAYKRGDEDAPALAEQQAVAQARAKGLSGAIADLEAQVKQDRAAALKAEADVRLRKGLPRAHGSVRDLYAKDSEAVERLTKELSDTRQRVTERGDRLHALEFEGAVLAIRFGLETPDLPRTGAGAPHFLLSDFIKIEPRGEDAVRVQGPSGKRRIEGDTGRILAQAGPWERSGAEAKAEQQARDKERQAEIQAEQDKVDAWLRKQLADGPVARHVIFSAAKEAGIPVQSTPNTHGADVQRAHRRLGVLPLEPQDGSKVPFWGLPDVAFHEDSFKVYQGGARRDMMVGMH